jgi:predicted peptidase
MHQQVLDLAAGGRLRYTLAVPEPVPGPLPLVLALHYGWDGGRPPAFYGGGLLSGLVGPALAALDALLAAPDCPGRDWAAPESEAAVLALLEHLGTAYPLDDRRTLVTGYSLGGMGAWHMASRHPGLFRAGVVMAGWPAAGAVELLAVPLYLIHSRADEVVPIGPTEAAVAQLRAQGKAVELVTVEGITHYQVDRFVPLLRAAVPWVRGVWREWRAPPAGRCRPSDLNHLLVAQCRQARWRLCPAGYRRNVVGLYE